MNRTKFGPALAALGLVAALAAPALGDNVTVGVANPGGTRTLYVENLAGQPLTQLDFGTTRAQPFRVRVVDSTMDRSGFSVSATMTNMHVDTGSSLDWAKKIDSANLSVSSATNPLNVVGVTASVQPLVDTLSTVTDATICSTLGLVMTLLDGVNACRINLTGLAGNLQSAVPVTVTLSDLSNLPLLPQSPEVGAFTSPDYAGLTANDPNKPATFTPTPRRMITGSVVSTSAVLTALEGALDTNPRSDLVPDSTITTGLRNTVGTAWDLLTTTQVTTVLDGTVASVQDLLPDQVKAQTGTYMSFPVLNVNVPAGAPKGNYKGTLVVTGLQP